ncbi:Ail/Lom family outer membrane beta-barrel protein [Erwinia sp. CGal63]
MYGLGLQFNPVEYLAIDIGYEGSRLSSGDSTHAINGFNIGLGYSF